MYNDFPILGNPTASLDQINIWAKGKPVLFRQAIPLAYRLSLQYGIDPVVTIAQIAIETGYCRYAVELADADGNAVAAEVVRVEPLTDELKAWIKG